MSEVVKPKNPYTAARKRANEKWNKKNTEKVAGYVRRWRTDNKDYLRENVECVCGISVKRWCMSRHVKTQKHEKRMNAK